MTDIPVLTFIQFFVQRFLSKLIGLLSDDRLQEFFGVKFIFVLISFWFLWLVTSTFIIHASPIGGLGQALVDHGHDRERAELRRQKDLVRANERAAREAQRAKEKADREAERAKTKHYTKTHHALTGEVKTTRYERHADGSVESWEE